MLNNPCRVMAVACLRTYMDHVYGVRKWITYPIWTLFFSSGFVAYILAPGLVAYIPHIGYKSERISQTI